MSVALHLTVAEFDRMAEQGAFDHLNRKIELIRGELHVFRQPKDGNYVDRFIAKDNDVVSPLAAPDAQLNLRDLFAEE